MFVSLTKFIPEDSDEELFKLKFSGDSSNCLWSLALSDLLESNAKGRIGGSPLLRLGLKIQIQGTSPKL